MKRYSKINILLIVFLLLMLACTGCHSIGLSKTVQKETVRDRLWVWSHAAGVYNGEWGLPGDSRITPVEGAYYLGVPNVIFIGYKNKPTGPFEQYAIPFKSLKRVHWSIAGAGGKTSEEEREYVLRLAANMKNITGVFMDDFFNGGTNLDDTEPEALTVEQLQGIRRRLNNINGRKLDIGVTLYTHQLEKRILSHIDLCDVVSLWTWRSKDLKDLEENFAKLKEMIGSKHIWLGCYMWDFGDQKPMPLNLMKKQCRLGLKWLKEGQIEGVIFLGTNICDLNLETVEWTRQWIAKVGPEPL